MKLFALCLLTLLAAPLGAQPVLETAPLRDILTRLCTAGTEPYTLTTYVVNEYGVPVRVAKTPMQTPQHAFVLVFPRAPQDLRELLVPHCETFWQ